MYNKVFLSVAKKELLQICRHPFQLVYELLLPAVKMIPCILLGSYMLHENGDATFLSKTGTTNEILFISLSILFTVFSDIQEQVGYFLENEMWMGTLEQLWMTPVKKMTLVIGWIFFALIKAVIYGTISMLTIVLLTSGNLGYWANINFPLFVFAIFSLFLMSVVNGIFISEISLRFRQADSIIFFITLIIPLLSGISYPIDILPRPIQFISYVFPTTYIYDLIRFSMMNTYTITSIGREIFIIISLIAINIIFANMLFNSVIRRLEKWGTIYMK